MDPSIARVTYSYSSQIFRTLLSLKRQLACAVPWLQLTNRLARINQVAGLAMSLSITGWLHFCNCRVWDRRTSGQKAPLEPRRCRVPVPEAHSGREAAL